MANPPVRFVTLQLDTERKKSAIPINAPYFSIVRADAAADIHFSTADEGVPVSEGDSYCAQPPARFDEILITNEATSGILKLMVSSVVRRSAEKGGSDGSGLVRLAHVIPDDTAHDSGAYRDLVHNTASASSSQGPFEQSTFGQGLMEWGADNGGAHEGYGLKMRLGPGATNNSNCIVRMRNRRYFVHPILQALYKNSASAIAVPATMPDITYIIRQDVTIYDVVGSIAFWCGFSDELFDNPDSGNLRPNSDPNADHIGVIWSTAQTSWRFRIQKGSTTLTDESLGITGEDETHHFEWRLGWKDGEPFLHLYADSTLVRIVTPDDVSGLNNLVGSNFTSWMHRPNGNSLDAATGWVWSTMGPQVLAKYN